MAGRLLRSHFWCWCWRLVEHCITWICQYRSPTDLCSPNTATDKLVSYDDTPINSPASPATIRQRGTLRKGCHSVFVYLLLQGGEGGEIPGAVLARQPAGLLI